MSGNELRVTVMTARAHAHMHARTRVQTNRGRSLRLGAQRHADGAQEERQSERGGGTHTRRVFSAALLNTCTFTEGDR